MAVVPDVIELIEVAVAMPRLKFRMKRVGNIGKTMKAFCQKQGLELDAMEFVFNDRLLQPSDTLASIGFEEGDQIICRPKTDADPDVDNPGGPNANVNGTGRDLPVVYPSSLSFYEYPTSDIDPLDLNGPPSDVDVVANGGEKFGCHIFVLKNNPVFRNVYLKYEEVEDHSDDENAGAPAKKRTRATKQDDGRRERRSIVLPDMTSDVLRVMLLHIYHGSVTFDVSIAHFVLQAAETHELPFLKRECEKAMSKNISQENLVNYFQLSEMANSSLVKKECLTFLKKNFATIKVLDEWKDFIKSAGSDVKTANLINYIIAALAISDVTGQQIICRPKTDADDDEGSPGRPNAHVNVKVQDQNGIVLEFRIRRNVPLKKVIVAYCERKRLDPFSITFYFDGNRFLPEDTAQELGMEDGDVLEVFNRQ